MIILYDTRREGIEIEGKVYFVTHHINNRRPTTLHLNTATQLRPILSRYHDTRRVIITTS